MSLAFVNGDVRLTRAQSLLLGLNIKGEASVSPLESTLRDQYPVFFSEYRRLGRAQAWSEGKLWFFRETRPWLLGAFVRGSADGVTRLRHVEQCFTTLRNTWRQEGILSLAIAPLGTAEEAKALFALAQDLLGNLPFPIYYYAEHVAGLAAPEPS